MPAQSLLRPEEAAKRLGISRAGLYRLIREGEIRTVTIGRSRRIPSDDLEAFIDSLRQASHG